MNVVLGLIADQFDKGLAKASKSLERSGKQMQKVGKNLSMSVTAPLTLIGASSFKVAADFELSMAKVKAISGATGTEFDQLQKQARDLGASTIFAASEVSGLQLELSKLGFSANEIGSATEGILNLAQATGEELGPTAETVAKTLNQFGIDASESGRVSDVMAAAFSSSALDLEKFSGAMANAGPVAAEFGFSLEETTALLGVLANNGIEGADAGTKLKMGLSKVAEGGDDVAKVFRAVISGNLTYNEAMDQLGKRAAILVPILGKNADEVDKLTGALHNSAGTASEMAAIMDDTASGSLAAMKSAVEGAQISLGTALAPIIQQVSEYVTDLAQRFSRLDERTQQNIVQWGLVAAAIGPVLIAIGKLQTGFVALRKTIAKSVKFLAANPYLAAAVAIVALGAAIYKVTKNYRDLDSAQNAVNDNISRANTLTAKQRTRVQLLVETAKDMNIEETKRTAAIRELNRISPKYLGGLTVENIATAEGTKALEDYNAELIRKARVQAANERLVEIEKELIDLSAEAAEGPGFLTTLLSGAVKMNAEYLHLRQINGEVQNLIDQRSVLLDFTKENSDATTDDGESAEEAANRYAEYLKAAQDAQKVLEDQTKSTEEATKKTKDYNIELEGIAKVMDDLSSDEQSIAGKFTIDNNKIERAGALATAYQRAAFSAASLGELDLAQQLSEQATQFEKLAKALEDVAKAKQDVKDFLEPFNSGGLTMSIGNLLGALEAQYPQVVNVLSDLEKQFLSFAQGVQNALEQAFTDVAVGLGELIGQAMAGMDVAGKLASVGVQAFASLMTTLGQIAIEVGKTAIFTGAAVEGIKKALETLNPAAAIVAGIALLALGKFATSKLNKAADVPALATGGITLGPQLALIGDNPSGREAIIPFERMGQFINMVGGRNSSNVNVTGRIDGTTIVLANERAMRNRGR